MNEIDKLYENVEIEKEVIPCPAKYYGYDCTNCYEFNWENFERGLEEKQQVKEILE